MIKTAIKYVLLILGALVFAYPFIWMFAGSLKPEMEIARPGLWSTGFSLFSYEQVLLKIPIVRAFFNSLLVSLLSTLSVVVFGSMVGYALAKLRFAGKGLLYVLIIFTMMIPFQIVLIPQYILMVKLGWTDTYASLIAPTMMSAFSIVLFRQFFLAVPGALPAANAAKERRRATCA